MDFDGDGKLDVCLASTSAVRLYQNQGESLQRSDAAGFQGRRPLGGLGRLQRRRKARPAARHRRRRRGCSPTWAAGNSATTRACCRATSAGATAAAWIDADGDGKPDVLVATAFNGLRLYRNDRGGLSSEDRFNARPGASGPTGLGGEARGETLAVADVDGDGKPDFLFGAGTGMLFAQHRHALRAKGRLGHRVRPVEVRPDVCATSTATGTPTCSSRSRARRKLYKNDGRGHFTDVIDKCGDLAKPIPGATSAAWGDFNNDGHLDVVIGCLRGPNRYFQGNGDGTFTDRTAEVGLTARVYNSQAVALADLNGDGKLDLVMANEGQDAAILFGNKELPNKATPVVVHVPADAAGVRVVGKDVRLARLISTGDGRGQPGLAPRFVLPPGAYQVEVRDGAGKTQTKDVTVAAEPLKVRFDEKPAPPKK